MRWKTGQAKQRFSEVARRAAIEPQLICNRERVVAAVVDPGSAERLRSIAERKSEETIADAFDVFREMATHERYGLKIPPRTNRRNPFPHGVDRRSAATFLLFRRLLGERAHLARLGESDGP